MVLRASGIRQILSKIEKSTTSSDDSHNDSSDTDHLEPTAETCNLEGPCESCQ